jgi:uncharacterized membrane protein
MGNTDNNRYEPLYRYDMRSKTEIMREDNIRILLLALILGGIWIATVFILFAVPKTLPLVYWPFRILYYIGKWGCIIGAIIFIIREIIVAIVAYREKHSNKGA